MIRTLGGLFALILCCASGCNSSGSSVSGKVTLDGQPLTKGNRTIIFAPKGEGTAATGQIDSSGNYRLSVGTAKGVAPGQYQVSITAVELVPPTPTDPSPLPKKLVPEKYSARDNPEMVREVKPGNNTFDFDLKSM